MPNRKRGVQCRTFPFRRLTTFPLRATVTSISEVSRRRNGPSSRRSSRYCADRFFGSRLRSAQKCSRMRSGLRTTTRASRKIPAEMKRGRMSQPIMCEGLRNASNSEVEPALPIGAISLNCDSTTGDRKRTASSFSPARTNFVTSNACGMNMSAASPTLRPFTNTSQSVSSPSNSSTAFSSDATAPSVNVRE